MKTVHAKIPQENRARLIAYFEEGAAATGGPQRLGVEVEHFMVQDDREKPVYYHAHDNVIGVEDILSHMLEFYPQKILNSHGDLLGLANETGSVTLEPAAQLELSIAPYAQLAELENMLGAKGDSWPLDDASVDNAIASLRAQGSEAQVYGTSLNTWVDTLFELAARALPEDEVEYLAPLRTWTRSRERLER